MYDMSVGGTAISGRVHHLLSHSDKTTGDKVMSMRICKIPNCNKKYFTKGYCSKHYMRHRRHGDPLYTEKERHGLINISEYKTWANMKNRCIDKNNKDYHRYGGRGIKVCERWLRSFVAFYADMGPKPFPEAQIDRKNNDSGYFPENCLWATPAENTQHRSSTKLTFEKARAIRERYKLKDISQSKLALIYGVVQQMIGSIVNQKTWKE